MFCHEALLAKARNLPAATGRGRGLRQAEVQGLPNRLFSYRHRRGPNRAEQALPARRTGGRKIVIHDFA
jgi:hypothetical protein